ncbi:MAG: HEAT repeat domain-containing protein [Planctomycetota bacterium]|jgi:hypothetical protein
MVNVRKGFLSLGSVSKSTYLLAVKQAVLLAMLMGCVAPKENGKTTMLDALFVKARDNTGEVYAEARDELLANGVSAIVFLERKVSSRASEQERWLAEIMLARATKPSEFKELEKSFENKVLMAKYNDPHYFMKRHRPVPARGRALFLATEVPPPLEKKRLEEREKRLGKHLAEIYKKFWEGLQISDSPLWKELASEVLLKGWPEQASGGTPPSRTGRLATVAHGGTVVLNEGDYIYQAMVLVGKLGEKRAGVRVLEVLREESSRIGDLPPTAEFFDCREAVMTLGRLRYKKALDTLLNLAEDEGTVIGIRQVVFPAIERMGDERAIPVLERISSWSQESHPGVEQVRAFASWARRIIRVIQEKEKRGI